MAMDSRIQVCFVLPGYELRPAGGHKVVYQYANHMASQHGDEFRVEIHESHHLVMSPMAHPGLGTRLLLQYRALRSRAALSHKPRWFPLDANVKETQWLGNPKLRLGANDVLIATACQTVPFVCHQTERTGAAGIYLIQHYESWSAPDDFVRGTWQAGLKNVVIAPWLLEMAGELGVEASYLPNAVDADLYPQGPGLTERKPSVLAMISPSAFKRSDLVLETFRILHERCPEIALRTFGTIEKPIDWPDYIEHVRDPSHQELVGLYQASRVYLSTADSEGWGLPAAESLLCGCGVASTENGGVRAFAEDVAFFSPTGDANSLADNVITGCCDLPDVQQRVDEGRRRLATYSPDSAGERFVELCRNAAMHVPRSTPTVATNRRSSL